jgi:copper chaperone CopZ
VRKALGQEPGVANVGVDLGKHHIAVTFDAGKTNLDQLLSALADAGYPSTSVG